METKEQFYCAVVCAALYNYATRVIVKTRRSFCSFSHTSFLDAPPSHVISNCFYIHISEGRGKPPSRQRKSKHFGSTILTPYSPVSSLRRKEINKGEQIFITLYFVHKRKIFGSIALEIGNNWNQICTNFDSIRSSSIWFAKEEKKKKENVEKWLTVVKNAEWIYSFDSTRWSFLVSFDSQKDRRFSVRWYPVSLQRLSASGSGMTDEKQ